MCRGFFPEAESKKNFSVEEPISINVKACFERVLAQNADVRILGERRCKKPRLVSVVTHGARLRFPMQGRLAAVFHRPGVWALLSRDEQECGPFGVSP